jgi:hypothetical protein
MEGGLFPNRLAAAGKMVSTACDGKVRKCLSMKADRVWEGQPNNRLGRYREASVIQASIIRVDRPPR